MRNGVNERTDKEAEGGIDGFIEKGGRSVVQGRIIL